jgi:putative hemolysin
MGVGHEFDEPVEPRALLRKLSPILKGYLRTGALICGAPAYDDEFGTADVLVLVEMEKLAERYKQHYSLFASGNVSEMLPDGDGTDESRGNYGKTN